MISLQDVHIPDEPQVRYWYWRGWRIRYLVQPAIEPGPNPKAPLLLLHGFGASLNQWRLGSMP